jgi:hypothetical protein
MYANTKYGLGIVFKKLIDYTIVVYPLRREYGLLVKNEDIILALPLLNK